MIIYLKNDLISKCRLETDEPEKIEIFEMLTDVRKYGFHFLIGDREILEILAKHEKINNLARSIYRKISVNYATQSSIKNDINFRIEVGSTDGINSGVFSINIDNLNDLSFLSSNNLLLENPTDTYIYEQMVEYYRTEKGLQSLQYKWEVSHGGGTTTYDEYLRLTDLRKNFTYCIVDSDKITPDYQIGSTSAKFDNSSYQTVFGTFSILKVHEIENLVPRSIIEDYIINHTSQNCTIVQNLSSDTTCNLFNFLDLKLGLNYKGINSLVGNCKQFYVDKFGLNLGDINCSCTSIKACNCFVFHPLGRPVLKDLKNYIISNSINLISKVNNSLISIYMEIGKLILEFFCKPDRLNLT